MSKPLPASKFIIKESLSPEEFDRFLDALTKELISHCGLKDVDWILREGLVRIQDKLNCRSVSDCRQDLVDRLLERAYRIQNQESR